MRSWIPLNYSLQGCSATDQNNPAPRNHYTRILDSTRVQVNAQPCNPGEPLPQTHTSAIHHNGRCHRSQDKTPWRTARDLLRQLLQDHPQRLHARRLNHLFENRRRADAPPPRPLLRQHGTGLHGRLVAAVPAGPRGDGVRDVRVHAVPAAGDCVFRDGEQRSAARGHVVC